MHQRAAGPTSDTGVNDPSEDPGPQSVTHIASAQFLPVTAVPAGASVGHSRHGGKTHCLPQKLTRLTHFGALFCWSKFYVTKSYCSVDCPEGGNRFTDLGVF